MNPMARASSLTPSSVKASIAVSCMASSKTKSFEVSSLYDSIFFRGITSRWFSDTYGVAELGLSVLLEIESQAP